MTLPYHIIRSGSIDEIGSILRKDPCLIDVPLTATDSSPTWRVWPLHVACTHGRIEVVKLILELSPNPIATCRIQDGTGRNSLHTAIRYEAIIKLLLQVDPTLTLVENAEGEIPLKYAFPRTYASIQLLMEPIALVMEKMRRHNRSTIFWATRSPGKEILITFLRYGISPDIGGTLSDCLNNYRIRKDTEKQRMVIACSHYKGYHDLVWLSEEDILRFRAEVYFDWPLTRRLLDLPF